MRGTPAALKAAEEIFSGSAESGYFNPQFRNRRVSRIASLIDKHHRRMREASKDLIHLRLSKDNDPVLEEFREAVAETFNISPLPY